jgi:hypothetical protein
LVFSVAALCMTSWVAADMVLVCKLIAFVLIGALMVLALLATAILHYWIRLHHRAKTTTSSPMSHCNLTGDSVV